MDGKGVIRKKRIYIFILIAFLIVAGTIYTYIVNLNQTVADTNIAHMKELSSHDSKAIENYLDNVWQEMDAVVERLPLSFQTQMRRYSSVSGTIPNGLPIGQTAGAANMLNPRGKP